MYVFTRSYKKETVWSKFHLRMFGGVIYLARVNDGSLKCEFHFISANVEFGVQFLQ